MSVDLRLSLAEWQYWDVAEHAVAVCLGLVDPGASFAVGTKHLFWSDHPVGNAMHDVLLRLVDAGVLERREEPDEQFRWNADFVVVGRTQRADG